MSLATPEKIRTLQRAQALYVIAKQEPTRRFHVLHDKVWREDILAYAYACCRANGGAPGVDGETFTRIEAYGVDRWLSTLREEVRTGRYTRQPVKRVMIPKHGGAGQRPLGIPTVPSYCVPAQCGSDSLVVTHPFHPLAGRCVAVLFERTYRYRPLGRVYICDGGTLGSVTLPESFTDRGMPAADRPLTADVLTVLAAVVAVLRPA